MENKRKNNLIIFTYRLVAVLVCAVLITTSMVAGLFAKYTYTSTSSDYARIAKFDVMSDGVFSEPILLSLAPSSEKQLVADIKINSECEVAVECKVTIDNLYNNIPLQFELKEKVGSDYIDCDGTSFVYKPNIDTNIQYGLFIFIPEDENTPDSNLKYRGMVDYFTITVTATQID